MLLYSDKADLPHPQNRINSIFLEFCTWLDLNYEEVREFSNTVENDYIIAIRPNKKGFSQKIKLK